MSLGNPPKGKQPIRSGSLLWFLAGFGAILAVLHLCAAFYPSGINWGIHILAYSPSTLKFSVLLLMLLAVIPPVQQALVSLMRRAVESFQRLSSVGRLVLAVGFLVGTVVLLWVGRERTFFLGYGLLALRNLGSTSTVSEIPLGFKSAPFTGYALWKLSSLSSEMNIASSALLAFRVFSTTCGVGALLVLFALVKHIAVDSLDRSLVYLFILAGAGSQLFFGYVETYAAAYFAALLFAWLAFAYLDAKVHLVFPSIAFGLMLTCHFGMVFMTATIASLLDKLP